MDAADQASLLQSVRARSGIIAAHWYEAIAGTSFVSRAAAQVRAELEALADQAIVALLSEPFAREQAEAVGVAVAQMHFIHPDALGGTIRVLAEELGANLPAESLGTLLPRLSTLLGAVAKGYFAESRTTILNEQDQIRRALFVSRQRAEEAEEARAVAEASVRIRTDVLNATAHDMRVPLTTIRGHADLMLRRLKRAPVPDTGWLMAQADAIRSGTMRMAGMVDELLDVARLQMGQPLELQPEQVDIGELVREAAEARKMSARQGGPPIEVDAPPGPPVVADRARLERVLTNLIGNAIKYSPGGTPIKVEVQWQADTVTILVRDQGVGVPAEDLPRLFTPFFRASTARGIPGIGIGLSGSKSIIEQHGGYIMVESTLGAGTTVIITLPLIPQGQDQTPTILSPQST